MSSADSKDRLWDNSAYRNLSWFKQDKVSSAKVLVAGCGALGNEVLKNLALFGVGNITIVDFDRVDMSNLTRSVLFSAQDAEQKLYKVEAAAKSLKRINSNVKILPITGDIACDVGLGLIRSMDAVIGCFDNRYARYCLNRLCMRAGVPWIDGGILGLEGTVRVFAPHKNCYACNLGSEGLKELSGRLSCSDIIRFNEANGRVPTTPVIASIIGAVQAQEALKLIHREEMENGELSSLCGKIFYYEGQHLTSRIANFAAYDDDCPVHETWSPVTLTKADSNTSVGEAIDLIAAELQCPDITIRLADFGFVDFAEDKLSGEKIEIMLPSHKLAGAAGLLKAQNLAAETLFKHEIRNIDRNFKYKHLTLKQIGFAIQDVLHISSPGADYYVQLNDKCCFA